MNKCPFNHREAAPKLRPELPPLTERLKKLPLDERGYPVPFFVSWIDGKPEFRAADGRKYRRCVQDKLCWVCGEPLGAHLAFAIGPMCVTNRTTAEPPAHLDCAQWSVKGCPFLARPQMVRRRGDEAYESNDQIREAAGISLDHNPGVTCIWVTKSYKFFPDGDGRPLIQIGDPVAAPTWWREGRPATRAEVLAAMDKGLPKLREQCDHPEAHRLLTQMSTEALQYLPHE